LHWRLRICRLSFSSTRSPLFSLAPFITHSPLDITLPFLSLHQPTIARSFLLSLSLSRFPTPSFFLICSFSHLLVRPTCFPLSHARFVLFLCWSSFRSLYFCHRLPPNPPFSFPRSLALPDERERRDGERIGVSVVTPHARVMPSLLVRLSAWCPSPAIALPPVRRTATVSRLPAANTVRVPRCFSPYCATARSPTLPTYIRFCVQAASYTIVESFCRLGWAGERTEFSPANRNYVIMTKSVSPKTRSSSESNVNYLLSWKDLLLHPMVIITRLQFTMIGN